MPIAFYLAAAVAILGTLLALTRLNAVHALLYLIVSLLATSIVFYVLGAPFVAALEVIVYAGAIMVLFVFVVMMLNLGERATAMERQLLNPGMWVGPGILAAILIGEISYLLAGGSQPVNSVPAVEPKQVGLALYGPYLLGVELASLLLMGALVGAYHLGLSRPMRPEKLESRNDTDFDAAWAAARRDFVRTGAGRSPGAA
jgi:NADH-quinone oxidoreductase subunit J